MEKSGKEEAKQNRQYYPPVLPPFSSWLAKR